MAISNSPLRKNAVVECVQIIKTANIKDSFARGTVQLDLSLVWIRVVGGAFWMRMTAKVRSRDTCCSVVFVSIEKCRDCIY